MNNIKIHLGYTFLFLFLFFTGFDVIIIWNKTFLNDRVYDYGNYLYYLLSISLGWGWGVLLFKKMALKYPIDFMLKIALLIASIAAWFQFRVTSQNDTEFFEFTVFLNLVFNIAIMFLICTLKCLLDCQTKFEQNNKTTVILLLPLVALMGAAIILTKNTNMQYYLLITSFVYLLGHYYFRFFSVTNFLTNSSEKKCRPYTGIIIGISFVIITTFLIIDNYFLFFDSIVDKASFLLLFIFAFITFKPSFGKSLLFLFLSSLFIYPNFIK